MAAFLVTAMQASADAASITFSNLSGKTIKALYITNNNNSWGPNRLGGTIDNGYSRTVSYDYHNGTYAVAVVFMNGEWFRWGKNTAQDLNNGSKLVIYSDGSGFRMYTE